MAAWTDGHIAVDYAVRMDHGECYGDDGPEPVELDVGWCDVDLVDNVTLSFGRRRAGPEDPDYGSYYEFELLPADARSLADLLLEVAASCEAFAAEDGTTAEQDAAEARPGMPAA